MNCCQCRTCRLIDERREPWGQKVQAAGTVYGNQGQVIAKRGTVGDLEDIDSAERWLIVTFRAGNRLPARGLLMTPIAPTKKTTSMRMLEKLHRKPIEQVVADAVREHYTPEGAASALGVSRTTLSDWKRQMGLSEAEEQRQATDREGETQRKLEGTVSG